jgi:arylformamidase
VRIIDLSLTLRHAMPAFPGEPTAGFIPFTTIDRDDVEMWQLSLFTQIGTHLDAPSHFVRGGRTVDAIALERCIGPATVVDARGAAELDTPLLAARAESLRRTRRALVMTGWDARFGESDYWMAFPSMTEAAADALVELGVVFLGLDTPSPHTSEFRRLHERLFANEMVVAECLVGLTTLEQPEVVVVALPLKLAGLDGSPVRVVAIDASPATVRWENGAP